MEFQAAYTYTAPLYRVFMRRFHLLVSDQVLEAPRSWTGHQVDDCPKCLPHMHDALGLPTRHNIDAFPDLESQPLNHNQRKVTTGIRLTRSNSAHRHHPRHPCLAKRSLDLEIVSLLADRGQELVSDDEACLTFTPKSNPINSFFYLTK